MISTMLIPNMSGGKMSFNLKLLINKYTKIHVSELIKDPLSFYNFCAKTITLMEKISSEIRKMNLKTLTSSKLQPRKSEISSSS